MTNEELVVAFKKQYDVDYSMFFSDAEISDFLTVALRNVVEKVWDLFQSSKEISQDLQGLIGRKDFALTNTDYYQIVTDPLNPDYINPKQFLSVKLKYISNGYEYFFVAKLKKFGLVANVFADGLDYENPSYELQTDRVYFSPSANISTDRIFFEILYEPEIIDSVNFPNASPALPVKLQDDIVYAAVELAKRAAMEYQTVPIDTQLNDKNF